MKFLEELAEQKSLERIVRDGAEDLQSVMRHHAPEDTGELEDAIMVRKRSSSKDRVIFEVGVPASSPAIDQARATEFGTWNYTVGSPASPKTSWEAKSKPGATMPWLRFTVLTNRARIIRQMRRDLHEHLHSQQKEARARRRRVAWRTRGRLVRKALRLGRFFRRG